MKAIGLAPWTRALAGAVALAGCAAWPCQPPLCTGGYVTPRDGAVVPANVPGLAFDFSGQKYMGLTTPPPELYDDQGTRLLTLVDGGVLRPVVPLLAGKRYELRSVDLCVSTPDGGAPWSQHFTTTPSVPLPTATGTLVVKRSVVEVLDVATSSGSCFERVRAAVLELDLLPPASTSPFLPVTRLETRLDGQEWGTSEFGSLQDSPFAWRSRPMVLFAPCEAPPRGTDPGASLGVHTVSVAARVAGMSASLAPATLQVVLDCTPAPPDGGVDGGIGGPARDGGGSSARDGGVDSAACGSASNPCGCGCQSGSGGWLGLALPCGLALLAAGRRRRHRPTVG